MTEPSANAWNPGSQTTTSKINGTPQGSVLSPTLFSVPVDNFVSHLSEGVRSSQYLDDIGIFLAEADVDTIREKMQAAINLLAENAENIGYCFSALKYICMHFCRLHKEHETPALSLNGVQLMYKKTARFLSIIFDSS